jgi:3-oxoacyl-(acyl-carrier-protein) synthase
VSGPSAVWITGLGTVGAWGAGRDGLRECLAESRVPLSPLAECGALGAPGQPSGLSLPSAVAWAGRVDPAVLRPWLSAAAARRMSVPSRFAVVAARLAAADAGLPFPTDTESPVPGAEADTAIFVATSFGPSSVTEGLLEQILLQGPEAASPFLFSESVANAPAAQIARLSGAQGPNLTFTARQAGPLAALCRGAGEIRRGRSPRALAGTVDEVTPLLQALLDRYRALARTDDPEIPPVARPFDRRRRGFLTGEGATVLVIEAAATAQARGARPIAIWLGGGGAFDPTARSSGWGRGGAELGRALRRGLDRAGIDRASIDLVVANASGAVGGDRVEAATLRAVWEGETLPPVVAPRGITGELAGSPLPVALLALEGAVFGPTPGFAEVDPELGLVPHAGGPFPRPVRRVLLTAPAVGGGFGWAVLEAGASR